MAKRRMLSSDIVGGDNSISLPATAQALYLHLNQDADDDGFNNRITMALLKSHSDENDLKLLENKGFIIRFESGVIVIKHWRTHNYIRKDTYNATAHKTEKSLLIFDENNTYILRPSTNRQRAVDEPLTQVRLGKDSTGKFNKKENYKKKKSKYGKYKNILLTDNELSELKEKFPDDYQQRIENISEGIAMKGYKYKSHYLAILKWARNESQNNKQNSNSRIDLEAPGRYSGDIHL